MSAWRETAVLFNAIGRLRRAGRTVERSDFPPPPLPALYVVDGRELTERQVIDLAEKEGWHG